MWALALVVGVVGGIYGIGGGSLLAPILIALGFSVHEVAPATPRRDVPNVYRRAPLPTKSYSSATVERYRARMDSRCVLSTGGFPGSY